MELESPEWDIPKDKIRKKYEEVWKKEEYRRKDKSHLTQVE